jgi:8-oxo-dGTP diphosphatase
MNPNVRVGIACFVWRDGKFLAHQRLGSHGTGDWAIPGGHLEFGESWEECAAREVFEETEMMIKDIRLLATTNDIFTAENKHYITIWMESDWESGEPTIMEPDKCAAQAWCTFHDLPEPLFLPWEQLRKAKPELFM